VVQTVGPAGRSDGEARRGGGGAATAGERCTRWAEWKTEIEVLTETVESPTTKPRWVLFGNEVVKAQQERLAGYYLAVRTVGGGLYEKSQNAQMAYEAWVAEYLRTH